MRIVFHICRISIFQFRVVCDSIFVDMSRYVWRSSTLYCSPVGFCCGGLIYAFVHIFVVAVVFFVRLAFFDGFACLLEVVLGARS